MSNQIGLILSFLFLSIFISFSNEIINYQRFISKFNLQTNQIAYTIQQEGIIDTNKYQTFYNFKKINLGYKIEENYYVYNLTITTEYESISTLYSFLNKDIVNSYKIYRKG